MPVHSGEHPPIAGSPPTDRPAIHRSIATKNVGLFLLILLVAMVPLAVRYYQDSRDYEISVLASKLEFFAERGVSWLDAEGIQALRIPSDKQRRAYTELVAVLNRIEREFEVDNAVVMRRQPDGRYEYVALGDNAYSQVGGRPQAANPCATPAARNPCAGAGGANPCAAGVPRNPCAATGRNPCATAAPNPCSPGDAGGDIFDIGRPAHIHRLFPATYRATEDTWRAGEMMHSRLFGGRVGEENYAQFLQINTPIKLNDRVVAILMLNKFATPVAEKVKRKTLMLFGLTVGLVGVGLVLFGAFSARMMRPLKGLTEAAGQVSQGHLDVVIPRPRSGDEVGRLTVAFRGMLEGLRQRDFIRDTFGRYLSQEVVDELLSSPDALKLGGELREVTFLVSDLRGFTSLSAAMDAGEAIKIVNRFLEPMVDIIIRHRGTVDEFQGDGILAFFGAPIGGVDDPERAVACAIEMQGALVAINAEQRRRGLPELNMGIGINTGEVVVGNIGSVKRAKYGALGTPINMAYRIESYTVSGQVLISPSTYERVKALVRVTSTQQIQFKGLEEPIALYEVVGIIGQYACELPERPAEAFVELEPPLPVACFCIEGKTVSEEAIPGRIERLSDNCGEAVLDGPVAVHDNLRVRIAPAEAPGFSDVYAKVMRSDSTDDGLTSASLRFTSLPDDTRVFLEKRRSFAA